MNFTTEHVVILERHINHYETLKEAGYMRNLDPWVFDELQQVAFEAIGPQRYTRWCSECVADMVRTIYVQYESWQEANVTPPAAETKSISHVQQEKTFKGRRAKRTLLDKGAPRA